MPTSTPLPLLFRMLRVFALLQYILSALGALVLLIFSVYWLNSTHDLVFITLQKTAPSRGQLGPARVDSLLTGQPLGRHYLIAKSSQQRLAYREPNVAKKLMFSLMGVNNSSLGRGSLALLLFSMLTGRLLYLILRDMRFDTPFTGPNARRIRWLALLLIGTDAYDFLAIKALRALVPAFSLGDGSSDTVTRFIVLDPTLAGFGSWKFGLVLLVIAAVYQRGVEMAREAELTI